MLKAQESGSQSNKVKFLEHVMKNC